MRVLDEILANVVVCRSINSSFITLIPKKERWIKVRDFHPISMVSNVHKITSKFFLVG